MTTESEIGIRLHRRRWYARLWGAWRFTLELRVTPSLSVTAGADTVPGAWEAAVAVAEVVHGVTITTPCPYDARGNRASEIEEP